MYIPTCKHKQSKYIQLISLNTKNVMTALFYLTFFFFTIMEINMSTKANHSNKTIDELFFILKSIYIIELYTCITSKTLIQMHTILKTVVISSTLELIS